MLFGIDVGGTYTDAALYHNGAILKTCKYPTQPQNLQSSLTAALKELLFCPEAQGKSLQRIVISTTLVTNFLTSGQGKPTALILLAGHSLPPSAYTLAPQQFFLSGMVDFRGKIVEKLREDELEQCIAWLQKNHYTQAAIVGKFSNRNPAQELEVAARIRTARPECQLTLGHQISARLNFPRRAVTAYHTALVREIWEHFLHELQAVLQQFQITCEVQILKADGGTFPLQTATESPCETIFSGPAASIMGALALHPQTGNAVVVDVGGTTCDIALIVGGKPLYASRGAKIAGQYTQIDAFSVRSIALGGDSLITFHEQGTTLQAYRQGNALCFGGSALTLTDSMNVLYDLKLGNFAASATAVAQAAQQTGQSVEAFCRKIEVQAIERLSEQLQQMFWKWEQEPAYKVWEVVHRQKFQVDCLIGIGAGAELFLPQMAQRLGISYVHSVRYAPVANAIGAALVRPTLRVWLHADTSTGAYTLSPPTTTGHIPAHAQLDTVKAMASSHLQQLCAQRQIACTESQITYFLAEQFNVISGWGETDGRIFDVGVQIPPGFIDEFSGRLEA